MPARLTRLLLPALLLGGTGHASVDTDAQAVLQFGPRVTGSRANEQARTYLETQLRALGYETQRDSFRYARFDDLGSDVNIAGQVQSGTALQSSAGGTVTGVLVRIPGVGLPEDFARVNVKGKIAVVSRGQIPFAQKAQNAQQAGALGVIIVNTEDRAFRGTLGGQNPLPILGVPLSTGAKLTEGQIATLNVRVQNGEVEGLTMAG